MLNVYDNYTKPQELTGYNELLPYVKVLQKLSTIHKFENGEFEDDEDFDYENYSSEFTDEEIKLLNDNKHSFYKYPLTSLLYAVYITHERFPEAEPYIMKVPNLAYEYAWYILSHGNVDTTVRWKDAEPYIMKDELVWNMYKKVFIDKD